MKKYRYRYGIDKKLERYSLEHEKLNVKYIKWSKREIKVELSDQAFTDFFLKKIWIYSKNIMKNILIFTWKYLFDLCTFIFFFYIDIFYLFISVIIRFYIFIRKVIKFKDFKFWYNLIHHLLPELFILFKDCKSKLDKRVDRFVVCLVALMHFLRAFIKDFSHLIFCLFLLLIAFIIVFLNIIIECFIYFNIYRLLTKWISYKNFYLILYPIWRWFIEIVLKIFNTLLWGLKYFYNKICKKMYNKIYNILKKKYNDYKEKKKDNYFSSGTALSTIYIYIFFFISLIIFVYIAYIFFLYDPLENHKYNLATINFGGNSFSLELDGISLVFLFLTSFIMPLCILYSIIKSKNNSLTIEYVFYMFIIEILLLFVFTVNNLFLFFICFEAILIPFFFMIGLMGSRSRKTHASNLLFFYTIIGSLPMLISIIYLYYTSGTVLFEHLWNLKLSESQSNFVWICFFVSLAVKIPIWPFHIWLPEAHVESPTEASVILASLLLKVGGYGFFRILLPLFPQTSFYLGHIVFILSIISIVYSSLTTLRQLDIKRIIAYSSVTHMNVAMLGLWSGDMNGIAGSILLMIAHGFVSGGLFFLIGMMYDRVGTKQIFYYKDFSRNKSFMSFFFFILILANIGMPLTCNFIGEYFIVYSTLKTGSNFAILSICFSIFFGTVYNILLFNKIFFGLPEKKDKKEKTIKDLNFLEIVIIIPIIFLVFYMGIFPQFFIAPIDATLHFYTNMYW